MPKACELKTGQIVELKGVPHIVKSLDCKSPSSRGAATLYKVRFNNLLTKQKLDESFKGDDYIKDADCQKVKLQYSYLDDESLVFMDLEDYSQFSLNKSELDSAVLYLTEGLEGITGLLIEEALVSIELPQTVVLTVDDTAPGIKGASASARTKPATLTTGLEIQVPEYLEKGETVKINTSNGKFISRA